MLLASSALAPPPHAPLPHRSLSASRLPSPALGSAFYLHPPVPRSLSTAMPRPAGLAPPPPLTRLRTRSYTADGPRSPDVLITPVPSSSSTSDEPCSDDERSSSLSSAQTSPVTPVHALLPLSVPRLAPDALPLWTHFEPPSKPLRPPTRSEPALSPPRTASAQLIGRLALLALFLLVSLLVVALALSTLPALRLPTSLSAVRVQISGLRAYAHLSNLTALHTIAVLGTVYVFKQAFSVPGTVLMNVLMGAMYGTPLGTALTCLLTAVGSCGAYGMARVARPVVCRLLPGPLAAVEQAVTRFRIPPSPPCFPTEKPLGESDSTKTSTTTTTNGERYDSGEIASYLLVARLVPVVPYAGLNLASGVLGIPLRPFFWTLVVGSLPYNFVTTQVGEILRIATDGLSSSTSTNGVGSQRMSSLWTYGLMLKLVGVSVVGILPVVCKGRLRGWGKRLKRLSTFCLWWWGTSSRSSSSSGSSSAAGGGGGVGSGWVELAKEQKRVDVVLDVSENDEGVN